MFRRIYAPLWAAIVCLTLWLADELGRDPAPRAWQVLAFGALAPASVLLALIDRPQR